MRCALLLVAMLAHGAGETLACSSPSRAEMAEPGAARMDEARMPTDDGARPRCGIEPLPSAADDEAVEELALADVCVLEPDQRPCA